MKAHRTNLLLGWLFVAFAIALSSKSFAQTLSDDPQVDADALCKAIISKSPPAPADPGSFRPDCDSSAFYFGIGRPKDFVAARRCAYAERAHLNNTSSNIFAGPGVLSMLYANGEGTPRNTALARRFVCEGWGAPAEIHIRLDLLDQIDKSSTPPHFDLCDTATSGLSEGWCQSIDSKLAKVERDREIIQLTSNLSPAAQTAFAALDKAERAYEEARASNEVDLSGTGRAAFEWQEEDAIADEFLANLRSLREPTPSTSSDDKTADQQLNSTYSYVRGKLPAKGGESFGDYGTIGFDGVQKTERVWLNLRDRWMDFIGIAYPSYPREAFLAKITLQRTHQLNSLVGINN